MTPGCIWRIRPLRSRWNRPGVSGLGISGYDAADWLREHQHVDMGLSDHRRIEAPLSLADDDQIAARLMSALSALIKHASDLPPGQPGRAAQRRRT